MWAEVALDLPVFKFYTYSVPASLENKVLVGSRVLVPVRKKKSTGIIVKLVSSPDGEHRETKEIIEVLDEEPLLSEDLIKVLMWASDFYIYPPGKIISSVFPKVLKIETNSFIYPGERFDELKYVDERVYSYLSKKGSARISGLIKETNISYSRITTFVRRGFLSRLEKEKRTKLMPFLKLKEENLDDKVSLTPVEKRIVRFLKDKQWVAYSEIKKNVKSVTKKHLLSLKEKRLVDLKEDYLLENLSWIRSEELFENPVLTNVQRTALEQIENYFNKKKPVLLHGLTGSGKTVIYSYLIKKIVEDGRGAILLVPEISLTPQLVRYFTSIFGEQVAVLHSAMRDNERFSEFLKIQRGEKKVVVGVRSAVFAPVKNLGLIIIDEEHENTYKQEEGFIYHARSVAFKRAEVENANLLLASATPSVETYYAAKKGKIALVELKERFGKGYLPSIKIVDLRGRKLHFGVFSEELSHAIKTRISKGEQVLLFFNRRGFAPAIICQDCGEVIKCPNCDVPLVYHRSTGKLVCHYCTYTTSLPATCPKCGSHALKEIGAGTERVEEITKLLFPNAKIARVDSDAMTSRKKYEELVEKMEKKEIDILVGTQMITKGLHFENVTLSGVILAEQTLFSPDFRAAERTYQLITQIAGRAGRGQKKGEAIIQTYNPEHFVIKNLGEENFQGFYQNEIEIRKLGKYPPFVKLLLFVISAPSQDLSEDAANKLVDELKGIRKRKSLKFQILGPSPNPIPYLRRKYRFNVLLKAVNYRSLSIVGREIHEKRVSLFPSSVKVKIDLDPYVFI